MIFEPGWFIKKMNVYAPHGYKFVISGADNRIAMHSNEIMGEQEPCGPFVSCFSFELLDTVYGGMLTKHSSAIKQSSKPIEYIYDFNLTRAQNTDVDDNKYKIYKNVVASFFNKSSWNKQLAIHKNALVIQALQDLKKSLPDYLSKRVKRFVDVATWNAIKQVFASMPICDMRYYQELYTKKMSDLRVSFGKQSPIVDIPKRIKAKKIEDTIIEIERLTYDVLPEQRKKLEQLTTEHKEDNTAQIEVLKSEISTNDRALCQLGYKLKNITNPTIKQPAREQMGWSNVDAPNLSGNSLTQMVKLILLRKQCNQK